MEFRFQPPGPDGERAGPTPQLPAIQVLRAVAALMIVIHHGLHEAEGLARRAGATFIASRPWPLEAGVDLFFVISGFVMVHACRDQFGRASSVLPFLRRRLARIVPIYWAATLLYLAVAFAAHGALNRPPPGAAEIAASFLFIPWQAAGNALIQPVYSLGWTLNYEMFFYLLFAVALPLRREIAVPALVGLLMLLVLAGQAVPPSMAQAHFWTRPIILEFGFGLMIGQMSAQGLRPGRGLAAILAVAALAWLWLGWRNPGLIADRALLYGLPAALIVLAALAFEGGPARNPAVALAARLGDASYAIYLLHPFVLRGAAVAFGGALAAISPWLYLCICIVVVCALSYAVWLWFERPLTRALQGARPG